MLSKIAAIKTRKIIGKSESMDAEFARTQELIKAEEVKILEEEFFKFVEQNDEDLDHLAIFNML